MKSRDIHRIWRLFLDKTHTDFYIPPSGEYREAPPEGWYKTPVDKPSGVLSLLLKHDTNPTDQSDQAAQAQVLRRVKQKIRLGWDLSVEELVVLTFNTGASISGLHPQIAQLAQRQASRTHCRPLFTSTSMKRAHTHNLRSDSESGSFVYKEMQRRHRALLSHS